MSPILGIWASSIQPSLNATSFDSIATVTVGSGGQSTISFTSIPSTYKHLQIRYIWQAVNDRSLNIRFNSDTASNYAYHEVSGNGTSAGAYPASSTTFLPFSYNISPSTYTSTSFVGGIIDILDYASTTKTKTAKNLYGVDYNAGGRVAFQSGYWNNSSTAINSITILVDSPTNFNQYSQFALYGIK